MHPLRGNDDKTRFDNVSGLSLLCIWTIHSQWVVLIFVALLIRPSKGSAKVGQKDCLS